MFGALGSTISGNTIIATSRRPLGGINMVDWAPWAGSFEGTVVEGNTLIADNNMMKVGIAVGGMVSFQYLFRFVEFRSLTRSFAGLGI